MPWILICFSLNNVFWGALIVGSCLLTSDWCVIASQPIRNSRTADSRTFQSTQELGISIWLAPNLHAILPPKKGPSIPANPASYTAGWKSTYIFWSQNKATKQYNSCFQLFICPHCTQLPNLLETVKWTTIVKTVKRPQTFWQEELWSSSLETYH